MAGWLGAEPYGPAGALSDAAARLAAVWVVSDTVCVHDFRPRESADIARG